MIILYQVFDLYQTQKGLEKLLYIVKIIFVAIFPLAKTLRDLIVDIETNYNYFGYQVWTPHHRKKISLASYMPHHST